MGRMQISLTSVDRALFAKALDQFYRGQLDGRTLELLETGLQ
jgi:uncharacterized protein (DUF1810 family)